MRLTLWILAPALLAATLCPPASAEENPAGASPAHAMKLLGSDEAYTPLLAFEARGLRFAFPIVLAGRFEAVSGFPVDSLMTELTTPASGNVMARVGLRFDTGRVLLPFNIGLDYEHDLVTGGVGGETDIDGLGMPNSHGVNQELRKAQGRVSLGHALHLSGGFTTSHWGMGLVANDGSHAWSPGSAHFGDPRSGDRVLRVALASGPITSLGAVVAIGHDWVQGDDHLLDGDSARQIFGSFVLGRDRPASLGFYGVYRTQESESGALTRVTVVDLYLRIAPASSSRIKFMLESEAVLVTGSTTLSPSTERSQKGVFQAAAALRAMVDGGLAGGVFDLLYASGDADLDDGDQTAFKPDPNFEMSLLLHRYVLSGMTGRAYATASDSTLSGYAPQDLDRYPTRESLSSTVALFPRIFVRPMRGLEVYGGPLVAFTPVPLADPYATRLNGGEPRNALGGEGGYYLGTEVDLGARFRMILFGTELTLGLEGGLLIPGSALVDAQGEDMDLVYGVRTLLGYRL